MAFMKIRILIIILLMMIGLSLSASAMANLGMISEDLLKSGKESFEQGDYQKAIHQFSKALLADPKNLEAKQYLNTLGLKDGLYGRQSSTISQMSTLSQDLMKYKARVAVLEQETTRQYQTNQNLIQEKENLNQYIEEREEEKSLLAEELGTVNAESEAKQKHIQELESLAKQKEREIFSLNTDVYVLKDRLANKLALVKDQNSQIRDLRQNIREHAHDLRAQKTGFKTDMLELERKARKSKQEFDRIQKKNKEYIEALRDALRKQRIEAGYAGNKMLFSEYKLVGLEAELTEKNKKIFELEQALYDFDKEVIYLRMRIKQKYPAGQFLDEARTLEKKRDIKEVQMIEEQKKTISQLRDKLKAAQEELMSLMDEDKVSEEEYKRRIALLSGQVETMKGQMTGTQTLLSKKEEEQQILETRLADAQERVALIEKMMQNKDAQIKELEKQLSEMIGQGQGEFIEE